MKIQLLTAALGAALLTACGGGGGDDNSNPGPAPVTTSISGVAATGAAIAGATVEAKCAVGSGTTTTGSDGKFTLNIQNATLPCILSVELSEWIDSAFCCRKRF